MSVEVPNVAAKRKKKKPRLPMSEVAHACSLLAVDPATLSGWSIWERGNLRAFGECDVFGAKPSELLRELLAMPAPHVVVLERPFRVKYASQAALGVGERIWRELADRAGLKRRTVRVYPNSWRARILPKGWAGLAKRKELKPEEHKQATTVAIQHMGWTPMQNFYLGEESAPAILIGKWGCFAGETLAVLPKPRMKKARAA